MSIKPTATTCYFRLFHAYPKDDPLTIKLGDTTYCDALYYEDFTPYQVLEAGEYAASAFLPKSDTHLATSKVTLLPRRIYTLVLAPHLNALDKLHLYCVEDIQRTVNPPDCVVRVAHFAHGTHPIDLYQGEELLRFKNIPFTQVSRYVPFDATTYHFNWIDHSYKDQLLNHEHLLKPIRFYSFYLIGNKTKDFPLKCVVSIDGNAYLPPLS
ncbi:MAG: DUF4397 domain-containing protein [Cellulosilyticaceae bacterium]